MSFACIAFLAGVVLDSVGRTQREVKRMGASSVRFLLAVLKRVSAGSADVMIHRCAYRLGAISDDG